MTPSRNDIRNDIETTSLCPACGNTFTPIRRQRYCSPACRQAAWRTRNHDPAPSPAPARPPRARQGAITVYECPECGARRLGQQRCHDCHRPCTRADLGGLCPHCDEPAAISDLTSQHPASL